MDELGKQYLDEVRRIKGQYQIAVVKSAGDRERRRTTLLMKEALLGLPGELIFELMKGVKFGSVMGIKQLSTCEVACYLADLFECRLYQKLQDYKFSCAPLETESRRKTKDPLKLSIESDEWVRAYAKLEIPLVDTVINELIGKEVQDERAAGIGLEKHHAGGEVVAGFGIEQARFGSFAR